MYRVMQSCGLHQSGLSLVQSCSPDIRLEQGLFLLWRIGFFFIRYSYFKKYNIEESESESLANWYVKNVGMPEKCIVANGEILTKVNIIGEKKDEQTSILIDI